MPKISVVMTVFNAERFLAQAVESILCQTFEDFEFIIVDNCSTDRSQEIIASYDDERIVFIKNEKNLGQTKALNIGLRKASGKFIARMDADDIADAHRLQLQYDFLVQNPEIDVVGSWRVDIDEHGRIQRLFKGPSDPLDIKWSLAGSGDLTYWCISHPTVLMRKESLQRVGLYNEHNAEAGYPQDYDLWSRMVTNDVRFANIEKPLLKYRIVKKSESREAPERAMNYRMKITEEKVKRILPGLDEYHVHSLAKMLEFCPQKNSEDGGRVLIDFDEYFDRYMGTSAPQELSKRRKFQMKLYYLPQLFKTNKMLSVRNYLQIISSNISLLFDGRFYRKILKAALPKEFQQKIYA